MDIDSLVSCVEDVRRPLGERMRILFVETGNMNFSHRVYVGKILLGTITEEQGKLPEVSLLRERVSDWEKTVGNN